MSEQRSYNLPLDKLKELILAPKEVYEDIDFDRYKRNGVYKFELLWQNAHTFINNDIADGLFCEIACRRYPDFIYHSFMLQMTFDKHINVIYQIEVYPDFKESHRGKGKDKQVIFGSHIHNLKTTTKIQDLDYNASWYDWLKYFSNGANINIQGSHKEPFIDDLDL